MCVALSRPSGVWTTEAKQGQSFCKGPHAPLLCVHFVYNPFKNVEMILSSGVIQMQATGQIWSGDHSLPALGIEGQWKVILGGL